MIAHHNLGQSLLTMCKQVPFGSCLCGKAAIDQTLIFRNCIDKDHHYHPEGMQPHGHYNMPILSRGKTLGILNLYVKHGHQQEQLELDFLDACGKALAGIIERKLIEKELYRLSYMDELTGVANRRKFMETLSGALKLSQHVDRSLAVLFLDLDFFKAVNDTHGHEYGDKVLIEAAQRMQACIRDTDIIARLGGDEFVILLEMILAPKGAISIAEKLIQAISKPYNIKGKSISIGVSIGISLYPVHDTSAEGLLKKADQALYGAKENRGKVVLFSTE
jgi:diguanylate cyclase (GGDEF)-like protein